MKRTGIVAVLIVLLSFSLFAQGQKGPQMAKITFAETNPTEAKTALYEELIAEFEAANPTIDVEFQTIPNTQSKDKLLAMAATGTLPDVFELNDSWLGPLGGGGHLLDLQPYVNTWSEKGNVVDAVYDLGSMLNDTLYWMPYGLWGTAVYYNKAMLEAVGEQPPVTMDDFLRVAKAITAAGDNQYGYSFRGGVYGGTHAIMWILGHLGQDSYFDSNGKSVFDTPEAITALTAYKDLYQNGSPADSTSWSYQECVSAFTSGVTGLLIQSNEVVGICNERMGLDAYGTTLLPIGPSGKGYDTSGQTGYAIAANTEHEEAAWKFLSFMNSPETNEKITKMIGFTPIYTSAADDPAFGEGQIKVYLDQILSEEVSFAKNPSYFPQWSEFIVDYATAELQKMILDIQSVEVTAANLAAFMNEANAQWTE